MRDIAMIMQISCMLYYWYGRKPNEKAVTATASFGICLGKCRKPDLSSLDAKSLTARNGKLWKDAKLFAKEIFWCYRW
jgi:hypothetical protein